MVSVNRLATLADSLNNQHDMTHCLLMNNLFFTKQLWNFCYEMNVTPDPTRLLHITEVLKYNIK